MIRLILNSVTWVYLEIISGLDSDLQYGRQQPEDHSEAFINQNVKLDYLRMPSAFKMKEEINL